MVSVFRLVLAVAAAAVLPLSLVAQTPVSVTPKAGSPDVFSVQVGSAAPVTVALKRVANYPAETMKKSCQDPMYRGLQVLAAWDLAQIDPAPGLTVAVYDEVQQLERRGYPAHPLATVQGEAFQVTVYWVTPFKLRALGYCHDGEAYTWWRMDAGGAEVKRVGLLLDLLTDSGREWWILEKCGEAPATVRKLEAPATAADLDCPPAGK